MKNSHNLILKRLLFLTLVGSSFYLASCNQNRKGTYLCDDDRYLATFTKVDIPNKNGEGSAGLAYSVKDGEASVRLGTCVPENGAIVIPSTYSDGTNTYNVTAIDQSGFAYSDLAGTIISSSYSSSSYSYYSPYYFPTIKSITIPDSVTIIGSQAFKGTALTSITLPKGLTTLNPSVFCDCKALTSVTFTTNDTSSYSITSIAEHCFEGDTALTSLSFPDTITFIGDCAFKDCFLLSNILLPNSLVSLQ
jgi:hypothetical protein